MYRQSDNKTQNKKFIVIIIIIEDILREICMYCIQFIMNLLSQFFPHVYHVGTISKIHITCCVNNFRFATVIFQLFVEILPRICGQTNIITANRYCIIIIHSATLV